MAKRIDASSLLTMHEAPGGTTTFGHEATRVFHRKGYVREFGIKSAVAVVFGQRFIKSKKIATTNWANEQLAPRQVLYAANDAFVALRVLEGLGLEDVEVKAVLKAAR